MKKQFFFCSAGYNWCFHCKCLNIGPEEYNIYMEGGKSPSKCSGFTRKNRMVSKNNSNNVSAGVMVPPSEPLDETANVGLHKNLVLLTSSLDENLVPPYLLLFIGSLSGRVDVLTAEVKFRRAEKSNLRSGVVQLRGNVMERVQLLSLPSIQLPLYAPVLSKSPVTSMSVLIPSAELSPRA